MVTTTAFVFFERHAGELQMRNGAKRRYFDKRAQSWNRGMDLAALQALLDEEIRRFEVSSDEIVMDLGCGTGVLTEALLRRLSPRGRVIAVDLSDRMLANARARIGDKRVIWLQDDARKIHAASRTVDRVIIFTAWPHFDEQEQVLGEIRRLLRERGKLHIWHKESRHAVNAVHASCGNPVVNDTLPPAEEVAEMLANHGFEVFDRVDNDEKYVISATKSECLPNIAHLRNQ